MCRLLTFASALVLAVALVGCSTASTSSATSAPCASCKWSAKNSQGPAGDPKLGCVVDGKPVDCKKTPPECPECAKALQGK